jgi:hypothetical protein
MRYVAGKRPKYAPSSDNEEEQNESNEDSEEEVVKPRARFAEPLKTNGIFLIFCSPVKKTA